MDLNLETLKNEILGYLESSDFAVFRSHAGGLEGLSVITWDTERCPDYRTFLDTARKAGEKLILFASRELAEDEVDEALEELVDTEFSAGRTPGTRRPSGEGAKAYRRNLHAGTRVRPQLPPLCL